MNRVQESLWQVRFGLKLRNYFLSFYSHIGLANKKKINKKEIKKILIIRTDRLGDAVVTTPLIAAIKGKMPHAEISILCSKQNSLIFKNNPYLKRIFEVNIDSWLNYKMVSVPIAGSIMNMILSIRESIRDRSLFQTLRRIRKEKFDIVFDAVGRRRTALLAKSLGKFSIGPMVSEVIFFYDHYADYIWIDKMQQKHIVERYVETFFSAINDDK